MDPEVSVSAAEEPSYEPPAVRPLGKLDELTGGDDLSSITFDGA